MENQRPVFTRQISAGTRVYFLDVYMDRKAQPYICISEIPTDKMPKASERQRIFIHGANTAEFAQAFSDVAQFVIKENENVSKR